MYKLTKVDNYFIATSFRAIVVPRCFSDIDSFEESRPYRASSKGSDKRKL